MDSLSRDGVRLAYQDVGKGAPPLVLLHDLGQDHHSFGPQIEHFRRRHRVVAVDLRGHGESGPSTDRAAVPAHADDLAWLCYELGVYRPVAVGRGLGGLIALDLWMRYRVLLAAAVLLERPGSWDGSAGALVGTRTVVRPGGIGRTEAPDPATAGENPIPGAEAATVEHTRLPLSDSQPAPSCGEFRRFLAVCPRLDLWIVRTSSADRDGAAAANLLVEAFLTTRVR